MSFGQSDAKESSVAVNEKGVTEPIAPVDSDIPVSEAPKPPAGPTFPEGGTRAWLTVAGAYVM